MVSAGVKHHFQDVKGPEALDAGVWRQNLPEVLVRSLKIVDLRSLHDESSGVLGAHTARHPGLESKCITPRSS